jgi:hypothetical protein
MPLAWDLNGAMVGTACKVGVMSNANTMVPVVKAKAWMVEPAVPIFENLFSNETCMESHIRVQAGPTEAMRTNDIVKTVVSKIMNALLDAKADVNITSLEEEEKEKKKKKKKKGK